MLQVEQIPTGPLQTNCYLVWDEGAGAERNGVIIDPGDDAEKILRRMKNHEIKVEKILATHCHFDHIGAVAAIKRELNVEFIIHRDDLSFLEEAYSAARKWGLHIEHPPNPDSYVEEGDVILLGNSKLEVVHTPGHSPGGVSYLCDPIAIVGDCLFEGSIGRTDFRMGSFEILERSIQQKLYTLPDHTIVYTGHGPTTTIGQEKRYNPFVKA